MKNRLKRKLIRKAHMRALVSGEFYDFDKDGKVIIKGEGIKSADEEII